MKLKEVVKKMAEDYVTKRDTIKDVDKLEAGMYKMTGLSNKDPASFLLISIYSPHIKYISSACGISNNKLFSHKSIINFLKKKKVKEFLGIIYDPFSDDIYNYGNIPLCSIVLPISEDDGEKFEQLVSKNEGSFRCDGSDAVGWTTYESE